MGYEARRPKPPKPPSTPKDRELAIYRLSIGVLICGFVIAAIIVASCNPYSTAWRTTAAVQSAGLETDRALAKAAKAKQESCLETCKPRTPCFANCYRSTRSALQTWREKVRPGVNAALIATVGAIQVAEQAKAKVDWLKLLMPAVCALARAVDQFAHLMGSSAKQISSYLGMAKAVTCGR